MGGAAWPPCTLSDSLSLHGLSSRRTTSIKAGDSATVMMDALRDGRPTLPRQLESSPAGPRQSLLVLAADCYGGDWKLVVRERFMSRHILKGTSPYHAMADNEESSSRISYVRV